MGRLSDWLREIEELLDITLFNKWLWIIIACGLAIVVFPFLMVFALLNSTPLLAATITILVIVSWGIVGGYKDWALHKRKQEKAKLTRQDALPFTYERHPKKDKDYD